MASNQDRLPYANSRLNGRWYPAAAALLFSLFSPVSLAQLVVNEVDYDQPGTDTAEFIEIKNTGVTPVNLGSYKLDLINGSAGNLYLRIDLPNVSLAPGDYFVVCGNAANTPNCDLDHVIDTALVQNGSPDAVAITLGGSVIDTVSYEGDTIAPYTEGSGVGLEDPTVLSGSFSISRHPDGSDTNSNNVDFVPTMSTPGAANVIESEPVTVVPTMPTAALGLLTAFLLSIGVGAARRVRRGG